MNLKTLLYTLVAVTLPGVSVADECTDALHEGLRAIYKYDFKKAQTKLARHKELASKTGNTPDYRADEALAAIPLAEDMLAGRVEKIVVIDSITVPKTDFLNYYRLSRQSGQIISPTSLDDMGALWSELEPSLGSFSSEDGSVRYITVDSETLDEEDGTFDEITRIYEGFRLDDGTWSEPIPLFDEDVDAAYPFMLSDGCTFYFASASEPGLGGYDIFRSYRDSDTGEFQNPVNMGLPYNSPANDYMLAIDEYTGAGWWATDRSNDPAGGEDNEFVTIYIFIPSEVRQNYDADTPDIKQLAALWTLHFPQESRLDEDSPEVNPALATAKVPGWKLTWADDADYTEVLAAIQSVDSEQVQATTDFIFYGDGGTLYTTFDELPIQARAPMQRYLECMESLQQAESVLRSQRTQYSAQRSPVVATSIETTEDQVSALRKQLRTERNRLFQALRGA